MAAIEVTPEDTPRPRWLWPLAVVLLPLVVAGVVLWLAAALILQLTVWTTWCPRGRYALVVYSDSPIWRGYFEEQLLPRVGARGVVLNWSERRRWRMSLPVALFHVFGGSREFNPMALVFEPRRVWPHRFRFHRAFRAFKHGKPEQVEEMRRELLGLLDRLAPARPA